MLTLQLKSLTGSILGLYLNKELFFFFKKHSFGVSLLWSPVRKSRVKALIN